MTNIKRNFRIDTNKVLYINNNSVEVLSPPTSSQTIMPPLLENPTISKSNFLHPMHVKLMYCQLCNEIYWVQIKKRFHDIFDVEENRVTNGFKFSKQAKNGIE